VNLQDRLSSSNIRQSDCDLSIKSAWTQDRRIQDIYAVCRRHYDDSCICSETVHLYQHLIQRLLSFIMTAAHTGSTPSRHRVDFINEHDAWCIFFRFFEQIPNAGSTDTDEHFHEIRTGNGEKRNVCFARNRLCQKGFTGSGRSLQQNTLGDSRPDLCKLARIS